MGGDGDGGGDRAIHVNVSCVRLHQMRHALPMAAVFLVL